jgi:hypothetical protein
MAAAMHFFFSCRRLGPPVARPALNDTALPSATIHITVRVHEYAHCPPAAELALPKNRVRCVIPTARRKVPASVCAGRHGSPAELAKRRDKTPEVGIDIGSDPHQPMRNTS